MESNTDKVFAQEFFLKLYASGSKAPWDIRQPQPAVVSAFDAGLFTGPVLDVGSGLGDNAIFLASKGVDVTAVDFSPEAVAESQRRLEAAGELPGKATFLQADVFSPGLPPASFNSLLDSAVFHCIGDDGQQRRYIDSVSPLIATGGRLVLLAFSDKNADPWMGPRRISPAHAKAMWEHGGLWRVDTSEDVTLTHTMQGMDNKGLLMTATRL